MHEERLSMQFRGAGYSLGAVRRVRSDAPPEADLDTMLDAATQAPPGRNSQLWHSV